MQELHEGPYLLVAALCEHVIEDKRGVLSLIGLVDRITHTATGPEPPRLMPPVTVNLHLVITLKSGAARGRSEIRIGLIEPSGMKAPADLVHPVYFEGEDRGVNILTRLNLELDKEGLYWFEVSHEGRLLTRVPLRILYQPLQTSMSPGSAS